MLVITASGSSLHGHGEVLGDYQAGDKNKNEDERNPCPWAGIGVLHVRKDNERQRAVQSGKC